MWFKVLPFSSKKQSFHVLYYIVAPQKDAYLLPGVNSSWDFWSQASTLTP